MDLSRRTLLLMTLAKIGSNLIPLFALVSTRPSGLNAQEPTPALPRVISLDGDWDFTYTPDAISHGIEGTDVAPNIPKHEDFVVKMPVPGYWDDHLDRLRASPLWSTTRFNPTYRHLEFPLAEEPPDAELPYIVGTGWYQRTFYASPQWKTQQVTLRLGGVRLEAWVWLNGRLLFHHDEHSVPFEVALGEGLRYGEENDLIIAVSNSAQDRVGSALRGYQGRTAGIYRSIVLKITGGARIVRCFIRPSKELQRLFWSVDLEGRNLGRDTILASRIREVKNGHILGEISVPAEGPTISWETGTFQMQSWSDREPNLYQIELILSNQDKVIDEHAQSYGLRLLDRDGTSLKLNDLPVMLRGCTDHYYFPETVMAPRNVSAYRVRIRKLKLMGFNWIRFHTWVPPEEYMQAADELGMMLQVEPAKGFRNEQWREIIRVCRKHPSVVIYCPGNEEYLDEEKIALLGELASIVRSEAPDAFFNPHEALRGVEYHWEMDEGGLGPDAIDVPFPHNPRRLDLIRRFSDVMGSYAGGLLSYQSIEGKWCKLQENMAIYKRPILSHELGIHGSYLNLDLEHRYELTRIGPDLFASIRKNLEKVGLDRRAPQYHRNSCAWMKTLRKDTVETARMVKYLAGYDLLGALDQHWHRSGYPSGITNEFLEFKPGEDDREVQKYNGESVLLLDHGKRRNFTGEDRLKFDLFSSLYGASSLGDGIVRWYLRDSNGRVFHRGQWQVKGVSNGMIEKLGTVDMNLPDLAKPASVTLFVELSGGEYEIANDWDFWVFPKKPKLVNNAYADDTILSKLGGHYPNFLPIREGRQQELRIVSSIDHGTLCYLSGGGRVLLLGHIPFPSRPTSFQISIAGRVKGNLATVIEDHPLLREFPHSGYCDWQFYSMLEGGSAVDFENLDAPFDPIIEVVSSFKQIVRQSSLFEYRVGHGRLLVSTLNIDLSDPATIYMLDNMLSYAQGVHFRPRASIKEEIIAQLISAVEPERKSLQQK